MNKSIMFSPLCYFAIWIAMLSLAVVFSSCKAPSEPGITPPEPVFVANSTPPDPVDRGIYADVGAQNAIDIEWKPDSTGNTSGYLLYRSIGDSSVGSDGLPPREGRESGDRRSPISKAAISLLRRRPRRIKIR